LNYVLNSHSALVTLFSATKNAVSAPGPMKVFVHI